MKKRILCLLLVLSMLLSAVPVYAGAATEQKVTASAVTITAGNTASVTLRAENFSDIATLEIFVYYDTEALTLSGTTNGSMFTNASVSTNTSEAGKVRIAAMSVNSLNGSGTLMTLKFQTKSSCTPGTYPITVAIGNVYDSTFQPVSLTGANGSVTVNKPVSTETFGLTYSVNKSTLEKGDTLSYQLKNNGSRSFVSGEFILEYDHEIFAFDSVELYSGLTGEGAVYSVNSSVLGQVRVAYANTNPVNSYSLFTLKLTVIADKNGSTTLKAKANNVYRADLSAYLPGSSSSTFTLKQKEVIEDHPDVFLRTEELVVGRENASIFYLAEGAGVAAADFSVIYDPAVFRCVSVDTAEGVSDIGGMLIINDNFSDGVIRFSYVNMDAYDAEELALVKIVWEPLQSPDAHYQLQLQGKGVVDTQQNTIPLDYVTDSGCILVRTVIPPVCLEDGRTNYTCACGEGYDVDIVPMLGHDLRYFRAQAVTCTEIGWYDYEACTRCEYTTYNEISALGHDYIYHEAKDPTCLDIGWYAYDTCGRCDYSTYVELAPLGHRVTLDTTVWTDPIQITNNGSIPFVLNDGIYYSNNHNHSSVSEFTITALYNCTLRLVYGVSSEAGCDWLYILQNGTQKDSIAGEYAGKTLNLQLSMGDVVTIRYRKDGSVNHGSDTGWVELFFDQVAIPSYEDVPADTQNPDCTHAVICSYCDTVIKEALDHDYIHHAAQAVTCTEIGWDAYETCSRCDYSTYVEIPALDHDYIHHEAKDPTCLDIGWYAYDTCGRCDYSTYVELAPLGHRVTLDTTFWTDPIQITNNGSIPFVLNDGIYYSNNHDHNSSSEFTLTASHACTLKLVYGVSSESNYDWLYIYYNNSQRVKIAGEFANQELTLQLAPGDVVKIRYTKDSSQSPGQDRGWVKLVYELIEHPSFEDVPADTQNPDCTHAVICSYCDTVIKEALDHDYIHHAAQAVTCTEIGWDAYETCSRCDYSTYVEIPALDHDYIHNVAKVVTCTGIGWDAYDTCSRCDYSTYNEIAALGHDYIYHAAQAPTCTDIGWHDYETCSRCDYTTYEEIPALDHDYIHHAAQAVTCTEIGWDAYQTCSRCDYSTYTEIPANGHSFVRTVCVTCGENQTPLRTWDVSASGNGSLLAHLYQNYVDGGYELVFTGSGAMKSYSYSNTAPWYSSYNSHITHIQLSDEMTSIGSYAFQYCTALRQISIPDSVERIENNAFNYSEKLVVILEGNAFPSYLGSSYGCGFYLSPQEVVLKADATYVIDRNGNAWLAKYIGNDPQYEIEQEINGIPVTGIGQYAFYNKSNLGLYWIKQQIQNIGNSAFYGCNSAVLLVEHSTLPTGFASGWNSSCPYYLAPNVWEENGFVFLLDRQEKLHLLRYTGTNKDVVVPAQSAGYSLGIIEQYAFSDTDIVNVSIPESVTTIGKYAFNNSTVQEVTLSEGLLSIGEYAFKNCYSLKQIALPQSLTSIGNDVFWSCRSLKSVVIPDKITVLDGTFVDCYALESVVLPDGITQLGGMTFYGCHSLKELRLPKNLRSIGYMAFYCCYELRTLEIPDQVHSIDWGSSFQSMSLDTLYIRSPQLAAKLTDTALGYALFQNVKTIVVPSGTGTAQVQSNYPYYESIQKDGIILDCYSKHQHNWQQEIVSEFVVCQNDGITVHTCSTCGVEIKQVQSCHTTVLYDGQAPTCTEIGWESYRHCIRCDYTTYTEIPALGHSFEDHTCTTCGIVLVEHQYYADGEAVTVVYETLENALNQATSGTIKLLADTTVSTLVIPSGVTLDLNKKQLTADIVVVMNNATILDGGTGCTGGGKLKIQKENLVLAQGDRSGIIPIWNGVDGYVFTRVTFQQMARAAGTGASQYIFLPRMSNAEANALLANGGLDNELRIQVCLTWNNGKSQQFYTYNDDLIKKVFDGTGRWVFDLKVTGISGIADMIAQPVVTTGTNVQATTTGISITG